jgi:uncharacterized protein YecE (DUF72 family)
VQDGVIASAGKMEHSPLYIGCAGWSIPKHHAEGFPDAGTHLHRYAARFPAVEINSSFYRPHRPQTYAKWAAAVPADFRFAVKVPKAITHEHRLHDVTGILDRFLSEVTALGTRLGPLLVQLPPSLAFDSDVVGSFFTVMRERFEGQVVCEPRHASWFAPDADQLLVMFQVARVAADPSVVPQAAVPGGWAGLTYYRLHGSPRVYYSEYSTEFLKVLSETLKESASRGVPTWCIFDNTAAGAAAANALELLDHLSRQPLATVGYAGVRALEEQ